MANERLPLFGSIPAKFPSDYSLEESIERLQATLKGPRFVFLRDRAVGRIARDRVRMTRVGPNVTVLGPVFHGRFSQEGGRVVLQGGFSRPLGAMVYLLFLVLMFGLVTIACTVAALAGAETTATGYAAMMTAAATALSIAAALRSLRLSRAAMPWLAAVIGRALLKDESASHQPLPAEVLRDPASPSRMALGVTILLSLASAATGVAAVYTDVRNTPILVSYDSWGRLVTAAVAVVCAMLLAGTFRRTIFGWRCGIAGLAVSGLAMMVGFAAYYAKVPHPHRTETMYWSSVAFMSVLVGFSLAIPILLLVEQRHAFLQWRHQKPWP